MHSTDRVVDDERARLIALRASVATGCWALLLGVSPTGLAAASIATMLLVLLYRQAFMLDVVFGSLVSAVVAVVVVVDKVSTAIAFAGGVVLGVFMRRAHAFGLERALRIVLQASSVLAGLVATLRLASTGTAPLPAWTSTSLPPAFVVVGAVLVVVGVVGVGVCLRHLVAGGGTADPFDPPLRRCTTGPYARWRHPMLAMQSVLIVGAAVVVGHVGAVVAALVVIAVLWGPVRWHEEHVLAQRFG